MRIAGIVQESIVDGPGLRVTVFTQGCTHKCPGCHNPETHDPAGGMEMDVRQVVDAIAKNPLTDGLTLSGGDPFCQAGDCALLAQAAHKLDFDVWTYTGWTFEQLLQKAQTDGDVAALLRETDVLVDGPFILAQKSFSTPWRGSTNQRLIDVKKSLAAGVAVTWESENGGISC